VGWEQARECVEAEALWLDRAAQAATTNEFDSILGNAPGVESPDDFDWLFRYLDVGVAGLMLVLSATRYATCYSCRGHLRIAYERTPQVIMATDPERARILAGHAARAGCGVESISEGLLCTYAASVDCLHSLAQRMLAAQAELAVLPPPSWFPRVEQYLASDDPEQFSSGATAKPGDDPPDPPSSFDLKNPRRGL
jgi:hypothetical protein